MHNVRDIVIFGIQGSGKGTQAKMLLDVFPDAFSYFSSGDVFRALVSTKNPIGNYVRRRIKKGELINDKVTISLFDAYYYTVEDEGKSMLLDGYPRSITQLDDMFAIAKENGRELLGIRYEVPDDVVTERMLARGREDDTKEGIANRISQFYDKTVPVIEHFQKNAELISINADDTMENIHAKTVEALQSKLNANV